MFTSSTNVNGKAMEVEQIEAAFKAAGFRKVDAYRYNPASIRVRVIAKQFQGQSQRKRLATADEILRTLPESIQSCVMFIALLTPDEKKESPLNQEFENPSPYSA